MIMYKNGDYWLDYVLSKAEREFIDSIKNKELDNYNANYRRVLKFKILKKRKTLTDDLILINEVLDELQSLWIVLVDQYFKVLTLKLAY